MVSRPSFRPAKRGLEEPRALSPKRTGKDTQYGDLQYIITHQNHIPKHDRMRA